MTTITEKLNSLATTKNNIKAALVAKGQDLTNVPFTDYGTKISAISSGSSGNVWSEAAQAALEANCWTRPAEWLPVPTLADTDDKVYALMTVPEGTSYVAFSFTTSTGVNVHVDWGDGTTGDFASGSTIEKTYSFDIVTSSLTAEGWKQVLIVVTPASGKFTAVNLNKRHSALSSSSYSTNFVDIGIAGSSILTLELASTVTGTQNIQHRECERVILKQNSIVDFGYKFSQLRNLTKLQISTTNGTNFSYMFYGCNSLQTIPLISTTNGTNFSYMFQTCYSLQTIPLISTTNGTNFSYMFNGCNSLQTIPLISTTNSTNFSYMFNNCVSLQTIPLISTTNSTNFTGMFQNCGSLQTIPLISTTNGTNFSSMFQNCYSLQTIPLISTTNGTNFSSMFNSCYSLQTIPLISTTNGNNFSNMFQNCYSLQTIPLISTTNGNNFSYMFNNCYSLQTIPLISTTNGNNFSNMFQTCYSLQTIPLISTTNGNNFSYMFNGCNSLQTIPAISFANYALTSGNFSTIFPTSATLQRLSATTIPFSFSVASNKLDAASLNLIFSNLKTTTGQTVTITGNPGAATCDKTIATAKGWTVTS